MFTSHDLRLRFDLGPLATPDLVEYSLHREAIERQNA